MKVRDLIKKVEEDGWYQVDQEGSHRHYKHPTKKGKITIAGKPGKDVPTGTLQDILRRAGLK